jgi:hypothetical protein
LLHDIRTASDVSIIDSSREAMTCLLAAKFHQDGKATEKKDLGALVKMMEEDRPGDSVAGLANVIARLHSRRKVAEAYRALRSVDSQDAELTVNAVSYVIKEFKWTK